MSRALVAYATTHGHTAKIAGRIAERLRERGLDADVRAVSDGEPPDPSGYDAVVVAGSVHKGHHQRELVDWVKRHRVTLTQLRTAFASVSLTAAEDTDDAQEATRGMVDAFVEETGWTPTETVCVAGALQYREYDFFTRTLMRLLMRHGGHPTDTSRDYDFTDWGAVERFADDFAKRVLTAPSAG